MEERVDFLTPDRRLSKVVHSPGSGRVVQIDDVVTLHYDAYYMVSGGKRVRFDSTAERGSEFSFRVLKEATLLGLENAVLTMRLGERATVRMSPEFGFGALGGRFHEFGKTVPPGAHIEFELTVLHISSPTDLEEMDKEREKPLSERMAVADQMRSEGNALFKANDYSGAVQKYKQAISFLRLVHPTVEQTKQRAALLVPLCLNVAQCLLLQNLVKEAEAYVSTALHEDPVNAKGLYRMAVCKLRLHEPEDAKDFVLKAIKSRDSAEARQLLKEINDAVMENKKKSEKTYKKIFE